MAPPPSGIAAQAIPPVSAVAARAPASAALRVFLFIVPRFLGWMRLAAEYGSDPVGVGGPCGRLGGRDAVAGEEPERGGEQAQGAAGGLAVGGVGRVEAGDD